MPFHRARSAPLPTGAGYPHLLESIAQARMGIAPPADIALEQLRPILQAV